MRETEQRQRGERERERKKETKRKKDNHIKKKNYSPMGGFFFLFLLSSFVPPFR